MSNAVRFTIEGVPDKALEAIDKVNDRLTALGKNPALANLSKSMGEMGQMWSRINRTLDATIKRTEQMSRTLTGLVDASKQAAAAQVQISQQVQRTATSIGVMTQRTQHARGAAQQLAFSWKQAGEYIEKVVGLAARGLSQGTASFRGGATSIAGSVQQLGIGTRMSGIALGQQLSGILSGPLTGNILSPILNTLRNAITTTGGIATIALEMGTRIVTSIAGGIVKAGGLILGGAIQTALSVAAGVVSAGGKGIFNALTLGLLGVGSAINNIVSSMATIAGEVVSQVGNVLTGLAEAFRGAFQAAVNIAASVLNTLVTIAQDIVGQIAGAFGTLGKAVLGVGGVFAGLAARDIFKTEDALTKGFVLLDPTVTPEQKDALRTWVYNVGRELGNIETAQVGSALERAISTGFQKNPEGAKSLTLGAAKLSSVTGAESADEAARAMAKIMLVFKDEVSAEAEKTGTDIGTLLADKIFAVKNFGDIDIPEIVNRIGDLTGPARLAKISLNELLSTLAKLTLIQGPEQAFTGLAQMMATFNTLSKDGKAVLRAAGIEFKTLQGADKERLEALKAQRAALLGEGDATEELKKKRQRLVLTARQQSLNKVSNKGTKQSILEIDRQMFETSNSASKARIKALDAEIAKIEDLKGTTRPLLDVWRDLLMALEKGVISEQEFYKVSDNIRASRSALGLELLNKQSADEAKAVEEGIANASGVLEQKMAERAQNVGFKMGRIFKELKQPFVEFWVSQKGPVLAVMDDIIAGLQRFNGFVKAALEDPGFGTFVDNLKTKVGGLFQDIFGGLNGQVTPTSFWAALNTGLDTAWKIGGQVVTVFKTLGGLFTDLGKNTTVKSVLEGVADAAGRLGTVIAALGKGDTGPLFKMLSGLSKVWDKIVMGATVFASKVVNQVVSGIGLITKALDDLIQKFENLAMTFAKGLGGFYVGKYIQNLTGNRGGGAIGALPLLGGGPAMGGGAGGGGGGAGGMDPLMALFLLGQKNGDGSQTANYQQFKALQGMRPGRERLAMMRQLGLTRSDPIAGRSGWAMPPYANLGGRTAAGGLKGVAGRLFRGGGRNLMAALPLLLAFGAGNLPFFGAGENLNSMAATAPSRWGGAGDAFGGAMWGGLGGSLVPGGAGVGALLGALIGLKAGGPDRTKARLQYQSHLESRAQMAANRDMLAANPTATFWEGSLVDHKNTSIKDPDTKAMVLALARDINENQQKMYDPDRTDAERWAAAEAAEKQAAAMQLLTAHYREALAEEKAQTKALQDLVAAKTDIGLVKLLAEDMPEDATMKDLALAVDALAAAIEGGLDPATARKTASGIADRARRESNLPSNVQKRALERAAGAPGLTGRIGPDGAANEDLVEILRQIEAAGLGPDKDAYVERIRKQAATKEGAFFPFATPHYSMGAPKPGTLSFSSPGLMGGKFSDKGSSSPAGLGAPDTSMSILDSMGGKAGTGMYWERDAAGRLRLRLPGGGVHYFPTTGAGNDPFSSVRSGQFGTMQGSMGRAIGENLSFGSFGMRTGGSFGQFQGGTQNGLAEALKESNQKLAATLDKQAKAVEEAAKYAKESGKADVAQALEKRAAEIRAAAEKASGNAKNYTKTLQEIGEATKKGLKENGELQRQGLEVLASANEKLQNEVEELRNTVKELEARLDGKDQK